MMESLSKPGASTHAQEAVAEGEAYGEAFAEQRSEQWWCDDYYREPPSWLLRRSKSSKANSARIVPILGTGAFESHSLLAVGNSPHHNETALGLNHIWRSAPSTGRKPVR